MPSTSSTSSLAPPVTLRLIPLARPAVELLYRLLFLTILLIAELVAASVWLDNAALLQRSGLAGVAGHWAPWAARVMVGFAGLFATFAYLRDREAIDRIVRDTSLAPVSRTKLAAHFGAMGAFAALSWAIYGNHAMPWPADFGAALWLGSGIAGVAFAGVSVVPLRLWTKLVYETGWLWAYTLVAILSASIVGTYSQSLWVPAGRLTFRLVRTLLTPFVAGIIAEPATMTLGTTKFSVEIAPQCSGFEGAGLMLAFGVLWLVLFRKECRFPQAFLLLPAGVIAIYLLNAVRIAALILIGNAGAEQIALGGFHSQAGWIAFNVVALGFSIAARRLPWLNPRGGRGEEPIPEAPERAANPVATYLLPFLSILAIGMATSAASGDFEWLYPLRFFAAAGTLWVLRRRYSEVDWRFGWFGPTLGVLVFVVWLAFDRLANGGGSDAMPVALARVSMGLRATWMVFRVLAAVVTVPIAEELAFRGFLMRRMISTDFHDVSSSRFSWLGLAVSSVAFGLLHGNLWVAGILAGLCYAWAVLRRGRLGEAVVAHATTNALLAAYVLGFHKWHLW